MVSLVGQSLGRYQILDQLGTGGMAVVYKAYDTRLECEVAIKFMRMERLAPELAQKTLKRFEREAKVLARLSHPNIVKVTDYGEHEGQPYLVMTYLPGGTLKQRLNGKPMNWNEAAHLLLPIVEALDYAHQQGVLHRDIKPSNILITESGSPMLADFGVAKLFESDETIDLTGTGIGIGTPEYMAPEQGHGRADKRSEVYALGIVLYELITGRKPYTADTPLAVLIMQATDPLQPPHKYVANLPANVNGIILKALAKKPEARYQSMQELADALEKIITGTKGSSSIKWSRRSRTWVMAAILAAFLIGSIIVAPRLLENARLTADPPPTAATTVIPAPTATKENAQPVTDDRVVGIYDDFQDSQFDGSWNKSLWLYSDELSNSAKVIQKDGFLTLADLEPVTGEGVGLPLSAWHATKFSFFEAKMKVPHQVVDNGNITLTVVSPSIPPGWTEMGLYLSSSGLKAAVGAENRWLAEKNVKIDTWYTLRIEFNEQTNVLRYLLDGETLASYEIPNKTTRLQPQLQLWHSRGSSFTGEFDNVSIGE